MIDIIPAVDIIQGKCVRLTQGDYSLRKEYGDPLDMAMKYQDHGISRLHFVDLDGAKEGKVINFRVLEKIATRTSLVIDAGGGLKSNEDLHIVFECGAKMATGGSVAVKDPETFESWLEKYGPGKIILGSDFKDGRIAVSGWQENSEESLIPFLERWIDRGIKKTICTDISRDGILQGPSERTYVQIMKQFPGLYLVASGGVSGLDDVYSLEKAGIPAVIIGKAIYEGRIDLKELERFNY
ncbi:MAG: 1-(5-phosphoribosyl)-5-[(5-phosphoribosylamino)methylideneamino] imidazole-4-carboxamide isomerase [Bacteroidales bacterium]|nr:1-(5-phosphoribosyl)-5-[(5-phosphoribosylamino)methylideneamino] imidazole-4-carboxamide isomerase [Bacteroidales bacterium]